MDRHPVPPDAVESRHGTPWLLAKFASLEHGRSAIEALESAGVDGDAIALLGPAVERARHSHAKREPDRRMLRYVTANLAVGVLVGAFIGATIGAGVGLLISASTAVSFVAGVLAAAATGLLLGVTGGAIIAVSRSTGFSESWMLTFEDDSGGAVWLALFDRSERAERTLRSLSPLEVCHPTGPDLSRSGGRR